MLFQGRITSRIMPRFSRNHKRNKKKLGFSPENKTLQAAVTVDLSLPSDFTLLFLAFRPTRQLVTCPYE